MHRALRPAAARVRRRRGGAGLGCAIALMVVALPGRTEGMRSSFYQNQAEGWFWYQDPAPAPDETDEPQPPQPAPVGAPPPPAPMSVEWLRANLPVLRDRAIDQPTQENVRAYYYAQRIMMDKAQVFSDVAREVTGTDPLLDENLRVPFASAAKASILRTADDAKARILASIAGKVGLWFFHDDRCEYCEKQVEPANALARVHGLKVVYLSRQGLPIRGLDPAIPVRAADGRFERLGVQYTPSVMLLVPPSGYYLIAQGYASLSALEDRIVHAAHRYGLVEERLYYDAVPTARGVLTANTTAPPDQIDWNSPDQWVPYLRTKIAETYGVGDAQ
jgi:conjugal transfer pilus assembly protein TraF